jgi:hypothetical protein
MINGYIPWFCPCIYVTCIIIFLFNIIEKCIQQVKGMTIIWRILPRWSASTMNTLKSLYFSRLSIRRSPGILDRYTISDNSEHILTCKIRDVLPLCHNFCRGFGLQLNYNHGKNYEWCIEYYWEIVRTRMMIALKLILTKSLIGYCNEKSSLPPQPLPDSQPSTDKPNTSHLTVKTE